MMLLIDGYATEGPENLSQRFWCCAYRNQFPVVRNAVIQFSLSIRKQRIDLFKEIILPQMKYRQREDVKLFPQHWNELQNEGKFSDISREYEVYNRKSARNGIGKILLSFLWKLILTLTCNIPITHYLITDLSEAIRTWFSKKDAIWCSTFETNSCPPDN